MNKHFWKIEYSLTLLVLFAAILFMIPTSFTSRNAVYISKWNEEYNKLEYMFTAMSAHVDSDIVKSLKRTEDPAMREKIIIKLVIPYLRLQEPKNKNKRYVQYFMNGKVVSKKNYYYFDTFYTSLDDIIVGIKDIEEDDKNAPSFMMMIDMNGYKKPNMWGRDIYGVNIFKNGQIFALGKDLTIDEMRKDCSEHGLGIACSHYYRIGGEFVE